MFPAYMDPSQPFHLRPQGCYHQGFGNNPHHMPMDGQSPCYGSCIHNNNVPAFNAYWPPCYPPQVPYHQCCMGHSGFHPPYMSYAPPCYPHPPFPVGYQQAWYDSEKDVSGKNQCGKCSPQVHNLKKDGGVVIEEHEPEAVKGTQGESVSPVRSTNCPYPIIWIPNENARNEEHGSALGTKNHNQPSAEVKAPENMTIQKTYPQSWLNCFPFDESIMKSLVQNQDRNKGHNGKTIQIPFDINKLKSLLPCEDMEEAQMQKNKGESGHLPSPTSWIPFCGKRDDVKTSEASSEDKKKMPNEKTVEHPFDTSKLKSLLQGQDAMEAQKQKKKEEPGQLQYPIFWIPPFGKREGGEASESKGDRDGGRNLESCPSDHHRNDGQRTQKEGKEGNFECNVLSDAEEKRPLRNIPVENQVQEPRNIPVKLSENHLPKSEEVTKRIAKTESPKCTGKEKLSPTSKASRLPPVCLRVDPLPKKRNGASKSLSPPKQKQESIISEETKVTSSPRSQKAESRTVPDACNVNSEEANKEMKMSKESLHAIGAEKESVESNLSLQEGSKCGIVKPCETNSEHPAKKTFTVEEAARIIQSRYRGYDVRRWEPIKKLKDIASIREQMGDIRKRIQVLEVSADQHIEEKETVVLGEMVMNLLLKLDAIQGLHPSIRDYRKSLARELSGIQEKIDSLQNSRNIKEKVADTQQMVIGSQPCDSPVNLTHTNLAEEKKMVSDSNTEKVRHQSPDEHSSIAVLNRVNEQPAAEAEEGSGLFETLSTDPEKATVNEASASLTTIPEKTGEGETVTNMGVESLEDSVKETRGTRSAEDPENPTEVSEAKANTLESEDRKEENDTLLSEKSGAGETVTNIVVESSEDPVNKSPPVVEETCGTSYTQEPENPTEVSEAEANTSESEDRKEENDTLLSEKSGAGETVTNIVVESSEDPVNKSPPVVEETCGTSYTQEPENPTEVSEDEANTSESEDRKEDNDTLISEKIGEGETVTNIVVESLEDSVNKLPPVEDTRGTSSTQEQETPTEVSEAEANASEREDRKEDNDTLISEKIGEGETATNIVVENLENSVNKSLPVVEDTRGASSTQNPEVSEAEANASESEDRPEDNDTLLSEKDVELSELPAGVIDDETELLPQDSSSYAHETKPTAMKEPETSSQEETAVDHVSDNFKGIVQESSEPQDENGESPETEDIARGPAPEIELIVKKQPPETGIIGKEQPLETKVSEHEISEETKRLMEENQRFKETMETLVKAGREQLEVISKLTGRVKSLEKKLSRKKRKHVRRRTGKPLSASCTDAIL